MPKDRLKAMELLMPDIDPLCKFNSLIRSVAEEISSNQIANKRLSMIRDTLMSRLMSGELDVSKTNL